MKRAALIAMVLGLLLVPAAQAGKISVSGTYDGTYIDLTICGTGNKTVEVRVIDPEGNAQVGQAYSDFPCFTWQDSFPAPVSGTYTLEVGNLQGHNTFASSTVIVP